MEINLKLNESRMQCLCVDIPLQKFIDAKIDPILVSMASCHKRACNGFTQRSNTRKGLLLGIGGFYLYFRLCFKVIYNNYSLVIKLLPQ